LLALHPQAADFVAFFFESGFDFEKQRRLAAALGADERRAAIECFESLPELFPAFLEPKRQTLEPGAAKRVPARR